MSDTAQALREFLEPDETAAELLQRVSSEPLHTGVLFIDRHVRLRPNHLALISGCSGSAKTELLIQIAATCILPGSWQGYEINGLEGVCVFVDLDLKFDLLRLWQVLRSRLGPVLGNGVNGIGGDHLDAAVQEVVSESLPRLHLVRCQSSFEVLATLKVMPVVLQRLKAHGAPKLLLVDNIAANSQIDRAHKPGGAALGLRQVSAATLVHLQKVAAGRVAVVATQHVLPPRARDTAALASEVTPAAWQGALSQHVFVYQMGGGDTFKPVVYAAQWLAPHHDGEDYFEIHDGSLLMSE